MSTHHPTLARLLAAVALALAALAAPARGQTIVPLNTGYNHAVFAPYPAATSTPSTVADRYWINIASYPTTNPSVGPSWVLQANLSWAPSLPASHWISAWKTANSPTGASASNPAYSIFRKCFCLLPNYTNPSLSFRARADNRIQVWFNSITNVALPPSVGNFNGPPLASVPSSPAWFRTGLNCLYVLVEDTGGLMGFNLSGTIQANGLLPLAAFDTAQSFDGCNCARTAVPRAQARMADDEAVTVAAIRRIAEERRANPPRQ
ncbi:MAG TPA: hypothetical protein VFS20_06895 [Longimicrobium sp.]|nr:hypothetical protein [Longimicrobium sp.]